MQSLHTRSSLVIALAAVIGDLIVGIENSDGNTNVRFIRKGHAEEVLCEIWTEWAHYQSLQSWLWIMFRGNRGGKVEKHCKSFYIRANRCSSIYNDTFALKGWKTEKSMALSLNWTLSLLRSGKVRHIDLWFKDRNGWMVCRILGRRIHIPLYPD